MRRHFFKDIRSSGPCGKFGHSGAQPLWEDRCFSRQLQIFVDVSLIDVAGKGRVGHDDVVFAILRVTFAQGVFVINIGLVHALRHQFH